jgi:hypothetical protein
MSRAEEWLINKGKGHYFVQGFLIGSHGSIDSKAEDVKWLKDQIKKNRSQSDWRVFDILELLSRAEAAHDELIKTYEKSRAKESTSESSED